MSPLDTGLTPAQSWLLIVGLILFAYGLCALVIGKDERNYDVEVPEPPSNVTVVDPLPVLVGCCCYECATAADVHTIRLLPEVAG